MKKKNSFLLKLTLLLSAFMVQADPMILQPNIASVAEEYPQYSYATITIIITVSAFFLGVASLMVGGLAKKFSKKSLLIVGSVLFTVGGVATSFVPGFALIIVTRIIEGFGAGMVITTSMTLIPEMFPDEKEANQLLGLNGVATAVFGAVIGLVAGYLGVISWRTANLLYLVGIVVLLCQLIAVPGKKDSPSGEQVQSGKITSSAISITVMAFLFAVVSTMFMTSVANFIVESEMGDSSQAGIATTVMTIGSFIIGFAFAKIFERFGLWTPAFAFVCMAIGVALPLLITTYPVALAGTFIFGIGYGTYFPYINAETIRVSPPESSDANISLVNGGYYCGMFASSFLMAAINSIFNDSSAYFNYQFMVVAFIIFVIYYVIRSLVGRKKNGSAAA